MKFTFETVNCDLCGSSDYFPVATQNDLIHQTTSYAFTIVKCKECGLYFTNPRPTSESIKSCYPKDYSFHLRQSKFKSSLKSFIGSIVQSRLLDFPSIFLPSKINQILIGFLKPKIDDPLLDYLDKESNSSMPIKILDIGCGSGLNAHFWGTKSCLKELSRKNQVFGVEISKFAREILGAFCNNTFTSIDEIPGNLKFDIIRLNWSLEHTHTPSLYFEFISKHLSERGIAIVCVPNNDGIIYRVEKSCIEVPVHLYHFSKITLKKYARKSSLNMISFLTFSYPSMYGFADGIGLLSQSYKFSLMNLMQARLLMKMHSKLDFSGFGNDLIAVFKKENSSI